jgi:tetratricopeptide (TPR) repeat protein
VPPDLSVLAFKKKFRQSEILTRANHIFKKPVYYLFANSVLLKGKIAAANNSFNEAQKKFKEALDIAQRLREFNLIIESNYLLAKLFEKNNLDEAAESYYNSAISSIDDVSAPLFSEQQSPISDLAGKENLQDYAEFFKIGRYRSFSLIDNS